MTRILTHQTPLHPAFGRLRLVAIGVGGALGALARAGLGEALPAEGGWPWGTFTANMAGTILLAWLFGFLTTPGTRTRLWRLFAGTGFCGALTTFSGFQVELIALSKDGRVGLAAGYAAASVVGGLLLALGAGAAGREMARR